MKKNTVLTVLRCQTVICVTKGVAMGALVLALKHVKIVLKTFALTVHQKAQMIYVHVLMLERFTAHHVFRRLLNAQRRDATRYIVPTVSSAMIPMERWNEKIIINDGTRIGVIPATILSTGAKVYSMSSGCN